MTQSATAGAGASATAAATPPSPSPSSAANAGAAAGATVNAAASPSPAANSGAGAAAGANAPAAPSPMPAASATAQASAVAQALSSGNANAAAQVSSISCRRPQPLPLPASVVERKQYLPIAAFSGHCSGWGFRSRQRAGGCSGELAAAAGLVILAIRSLKEVATACRPLHRPRLLEADRLKPPPAPWHRQQSRVCVHALIVQHEAAGLLS